MEKKINTSYYYRFSRPDLQSLVPSDAQSILDIGCGNGMVGGALKNRQQCRVVGIELSKPAAREAKKILDKVITGNVEKYSTLLQLQDESFDCIILGDILEHLNEPVQLINQLKRFLRPNGCLVLSIPNIGHWSIWQGLLAGEWQYSDAGLLDKSHLRFFTRKSIIRFLTDAEYEISELKGVMISNEEIINEISKVARACDVFDGSLTQELSIYQFLAKAKAADQKTFKTGLTSIIILVRNQLVYTAACLESIVRNTALPYELIIVDNGSDTETKEFLASFVERVPNVKLLRSEENLGFAAGNNWGISVASGDYIMFLNNDTVVPPNWLYRLYNCLAEHQSIGIVGPMTNNISGTQKVSQISYDPEGVLENVEEFEVFAKVFYQSHAKKRSIVSRLVGFCMLAKKEVIDDIGGFDTHFGLGNFEDDDFCLRAQLAGYLCVKAEDAFIHHFGSRTFIGEQLPFQQMMQENLAKFKKKWLQRGMVFDGYGSLAGLVFDPIADYVAPKEPVNQKHQCIYFFYNRDFKALKKVVMKIIDEQPESQLFIIGGPDSEDIMSFLKKEFGTWLEEQRSLEIAILKETPCFDSLFVKPDCLIVHKADDRSGQWQLFKDNGTKILWI